MRNYIARSEHTYIIIVTSDHLSKGDLLAVAVGGFIWVQGLAAQIGHGDVGGVWEIHGRLFGRPGCQQKQTLQTCTLYTSGRYKYM